MAGNNNCIHWYNPIYRNEDQQPANHYAFRTSPQGRPAGFNNRVIRDNQGEALAVNNNVILDHQGHIVPQNILNLILDPLIDELAPFASVENFNEQLLHAHPWLQHVIDYYNGTAIPEIDIETVDAQERYDDFLSIVTWNPVNICRAPEDAHRPNNQPGDTIDAQVVAYLNDHAEDLNAEWLQALNALVAAPQDLPTIEAYITACCTTLPAQLQNGMGYYAFPWHVVNNQVIAGLPAAVNA